MLCICNKNVRYELTLWPREHDLWGPLNAFCLSFYFIWYQCQLADFFRFPSHSIPHDFIFNSFLLLSLTDLLLTFNLTYTNLIFFPCSINLFYLVLFPSSYFIHPHPRPPAPRSIFLLSLSTGEVLLLFIYFHPCCIFSAFSFRNSYCS